VVTGSPTAVEVGGAGVDSEVAVGVAGVLVAAGSTEAVLEAEVSAGSDGSRGSESARFAKMRSAFVLAPLWVAKT